MESCPDTIPHTVDGGSPGPRSELMSRQRDQCAPVPRMCHRCFTKNIEKTPVTIAGPGAAVRSMAVRVRSRNHAKTQETAQHAFAYGSSAPLTLIAQRTRKLADSTCRRGSPGPNLPAHYSARVGQPPIACSVSHTTHIGCRQAAPLCATARGWSRQSMHSQRSRRAGRAVPAGSRPRCRPPDGHSEREARDHGGGRGQVGVASGRVPGCQRPSPRDGRSLPP